MFPIDTMRGGRLFSPKISTISSARAGAHSVNAVRMATAGPRSHGSRKILHDRRLDGPQTVRLPILMTSSQGCHGEARPVQKRRSCTSRQNEGEHVELASSRRPNAMTPFG